MIKTSEWVSIGHPDKVADYISSYLLDRYVEQDPETRYAVEVMIKDNHVIFGGEVTSKCTMDYNDYVTYTKEALRNIGYDEEYAKKWENNAIDINKIHVQVFVQEQSKDIAQGVNNGGWGDQGIFFGYAENRPHFDNLPLDYFYARYIGKKLYENAKNGIGGLDIKTMVTIDDSFEEPKIIQIVAAVPTIDEEEYNLVKEKLLNSILPIPEDCEVILNGTGIYKIHSSVGDCGITGRKLVVDAYGSGSKIGGGSTWGKDYTKADVSLNIYARHLALKALSEHKGAEYANVKLSSVIGKDEVKVSLEYGDKTSSAIEESVVYITAKQIGLNKPTFAKRCLEGLYGNE